MRGRWALPTERKQRAEAGWGWGRPRRHLAQSWGLVMMMVRRAVAMLLLVEGCVGDLYLHVSPSCDGQRSNATAMMLTLPPVRPGGLADAARDEQPCR